MSLLREDDAASGGTITTSGAGSLTVTNSILYGANTVAGIAHTLSIVAIACDSEVASEESVRQERHHRGALPDEAAHRRDDRGAEGGVAQEVERDERRLAGGRQRDGDVGDRLAGGLPQTGGQPRGRPVRGECVLVDGVGQLVQALVGDRREAAHDDALGRARHQRVDRAAQLGRVGRAIITAACAADPGAVIAEIRPDNLASQAAFAAAGFVRCPPRDRAGALAYRWSRP